MAACMTRGKIRRRLGYDLAEKYHYRHSKEFYPECGERRAGKTIDLMITVMGALMRGERVIIVAHNAAYAHHLEVTARLHAETLKLDPKKVRAFGIKFEQHYRWSSDRLVYDHWCHETEPPLPKPNPPVERMASVRDPWRALRHLR